MNDSPGYVIITPSANEVTKNTVTFKSPLKVRKTEHVTQEKISNLTSAVRPLGGENRKHLAVVDLDDTVSEDKEKSLQLTDFLSIKDYDDSHLRSVKQKDCKRGILRPELRNDDRITINVHSLHRTKAPVKVVNLEIPGESGLQARSNPFQQELGELLRFSYDLYANFDEAYRNHTTEGQTSLGLEKEVVQVEIPDDKEHLRKDLYLSPGRALLYHFIQMC